MSVNHMGKRYWSEIFLIQYSKIKSLESSDQTAVENRPDQNDGGLVQPDSGTIEVGETVKIGYFAQEEQEMDDSQRVIDYVKEIGEYIVTRDGRISASQLLERFLFTPDMQYAPIGKLSGGEKRRLYLLGILAQNINLLLIDEAGNYLDIPTLTILEDYSEFLSGDCDHDFP